MDSKQEEMFHIYDIMFNKFDRETLKTKKNIYTIDEILECVKEQIKDKENYKKIEKAIINVLLLDAVTNNCDRHPFNWALVRNKETGKYDLAVFDHSLAFINMLDYRTSCLTGDGWATTYIDASTQEKDGFGRSTGNEVIRYIQKKHPKYFEEFCDIFNKRLDNALKNVENEKMNIEFQRLSNKMREKRKLLEELRNRGER